MRPSSPRDRASALTSQPSSPRGVAFARSLGALALALGAGCGDADRPTPTPPSGAPELAALSVSPRGMYPAFSPEIHDYAIPCSAGNNTLTFRATAATGARARWRTPAGRELLDGEAALMVVPEDSAVIVDVEGGGGATSEYWIRCLPGDFPALDVRRPGAVNAGWYLLGNPSFDNGETGYVMILDEHGTPVWYRRVGDEGAGLLTAIGKNRVGYSKIFGFVFGVDPTGKFQVEDLAAGTLANVGTVGGPTDQHELETTADGNLLMFTYAVKSGFDLTSIGIKDKLIADCVIEELALDGRLVWRWDAVDHLDVLTESTLPLQANANGKLVRDVWHCNSIHRQANGDLLVSMRHADAVIMISRATGKVLWKLAGTPVNKDGAQILRHVGDPEGGFLQQHDARLLENGRVALFDNHTALNQPARGMEIALDYSAGTAATVWEYAAKPPWLNSLAMGSFRSYPSGERVVGWGVLGSATPSPALTETDAEGNVLLEIDLVNGGRAYRALKAPASQFDRDVLRKSAGRARP